MITLKELVEWQKLIGATDLQIIREYFIQNDNEEDAIQMITDLSVSKIGKLRNQLNLIKTWAHILPSEYLYENYDLKTATLLHRLELAYLSYGEELSNRWLEIAKERIPEIKRPGVYFNPLIEYMEQKGIKFKDAE